MTTRSRPHNVPEAIWNSADDLERELLIRMSDQGLNGVDLAIRVMNEIHVAKAAAEFQRNERQRRVVELTAGMDPSTKNKYVNADTFILPWERT